MEPFVNLLAELQKIAAIYAVVVSLAPLVLAKGSDFNQKWEADIGRHRLRRSSARIAS